MNGTVVYVHGDGEQPKEEDLKQAWDEALFGTDVGEHSRMAYWSNPVDRCEDHRVRNDGEHHHEIGPYLGAHPIQAAIHELLGVPRRS